MQVKGFIGLLLLAAVFPLLIAVAESGNAQTKEFGEAKSAAMQLESASYLRAEVEQNTDILLEKTMQKELLAGNPSAQLLEKIAAEKLFQYFEEAEKSNENPGIKFYSAKMLGWKKIEAEKEKAGKNFKAIIVKTPAKIVFAELFYSGGLAKNEVLFGAIESNNQESVFRIPVDYAVKVVVVK